MVPVTEEIFLSFLLLLVPSFLDLLGCPWSWRSSTDWCLWDPLFREFGFRCTSCVSICSSLSNWEQSCCHSTEKFYQTWNPFHPQLFSSILPRKVLLAVLVWELLFDVRVPLSFFPRENELWFLGSWLSWCMLLLLLLPMMRRRIHEVPFCPQVLYHLPTCLPLPYLSVPFPVPNL